MRRLRARTPFRPLLLGGLLAFAAASSSSCVKLPRNVGDAAGAAQKELRAGASASPRINLNTATREELQRLPGVGPALAARVVEHRERHGPFRRAEHLIIVRGFSERRFEELRHLIAIE